MSSGAYLGYSASGEVTAQLVYAHSGNPEDYAYLRKHGIDVRGKIALVRYSNPYSYRGFKALTAERLGVAALLIYSDPAEDGYKRGTVYPDGPWGPESHIQRGAITYDFLEPGDPLTPGWASVPGAKRIPLDKRSRFRKSWLCLCPGTMLSRSCENLDGPVAPDEWQGGLPLKYRLGGKRVRVHVKVDMNTNVEPYYVSEARIRGSESPDEWVILGNHRDAWVFGAVDPSSGTASMLELTRSLGQLLKQGIRPKRTLVICSWDGEEYALTGSTEWGEQYADELKKKAVAYLNVDEATSGKDFQGDAVGSLAPLLVEVSRTLACAFRQDAIRRVERFRAIRTSRRRTRSGFGVGQHANRQRLRSHGVPEFSRHSHGRAHVRRPLRRVPLHVRRFLLDESFWRSRISVSHADVATLGRDGAAPRECGHPSF